MPRGLGVAATESAVGRLDRLAGFVDGCRGRLWAMAVPVAVPEVAPDVAPERSGAPRGRPRESR